MDNQPAVLFSFWRQNTISNTGSPPPIHTPHYTHTALTLTLTRTPPPPPPPPLPPSTDTETMSNEVDQSDALVKRKETKDILWREKGGGIGERERDGASERASERGIRYSHKNIWFVDWPYSLYTVNLDRFGCEFLQDYRRAGSVIISKHIWAWAQPDHFYIGCLYWLLGFKSTYHQSKKIEGSTHWAWLVSTIFI